MFSQIGHIEWPYLVKLAILIWLINLLAMPIKLLANLLKYVLPTYLPTYLLTIYLPIIYLPIYLPSTYLCFT